MTKLRIALAGAGLIGRVHARLIAASDDCELAGICDPSPESRTFADENGVPWFADHVDLLDAVTPDGLVIASPNTLHVPQALDALARGVPVLVEKPVAESMASARRLLAAAKASTVPVLVGHHRRHNPLIKAARAKVASGALGKLVAVNSLWLIRKPEDYFAAAPWRSQPGGGPVLMNMVHDIDNLRFICGEIISVQAITSNAVRGFVVEDTAAVILRFANGALGTVIVSDTASSPWSWEISSGEAPAYPKRDELCYMLAGTSGSVSVPKGEFWHYDGREHWYEPLLHEPLDYAPADPLVEQLRHFCAVIRGTEAPLISAEDGARTLAVIEAVHAAARSGQAVDPDTFLEDRA